VELRAHAHAAVAAAGIVIRHDDANLTQLLQRVPQVAAIRRRKNGKQVLRDE
jgi:hypothetical protein